MLSLISNTTSIIELKILKNNTLFQICKQMTIKSELYVLNNSTKTCFVLILFSRMQQFETEDVNNKVKEERCTLMHKEQNVYK